MKNIRLIAGAWLFTLFVACQTPQGAPDTTMPGGVGEAGVPCVAPAIANAYARLKSTRVRELPFHPGATMSD